MGSVFLLLLKVSYGSGVHGKRTGDRELISQGIAVLAFIAFCAAAYVSSVPM